MIFPRKQGFALQHLRKYTSRTPDVHLNIVLLPREHDLRRTIVSRRNISRHLRVLDSSQTEIANFQIAIFIDENITWLQVTVDHSGGMNIFKAPLLSSAAAVGVGAIVTYQDLIEEVLDELLFQRSRGQEAMKISAQEFGHEITRGQEHPFISIAKRGNLLGSISYMSSSGEIKISLKLITFALFSLCFVPWWAKDYTFSWRRCLSSLSSL